eukprot:14238079-Alexandrium_andersonii.AAC.1
MSVLPASPGLLRLSSAPPPRSCTRRVAPPRRLHLRCCSLPHSARGGVCRRPLRRSGPLRGTRLSRAGWHPLFALRLLGGPARPAPPWAVSERWHPLRPL